MEQIIFVVGDGVQITQPDPSKLYFELSVDPRVVKQSVIHDDTLYAVNGLLRYAFFEEMNEERVGEASEWLTKQKKNNYRSNTEMNFLTLARAMVSEFKAPYWINKIEPGRAPDGSLRFEPGLPVMCGLSPKEWENILGKFAPERGSRMSTDMERFLYLAWRAARGFMTLDEIVCGSTRLGNYRKALYVERTGARLVADSYDGIGNTLQMCKHAFGHVLLGGLYNEDGLIYPMVANRNRDAQKEHIMCTAACCTLTLPG